MSVTLKDRKECEPNPNPNEYASYPNPVIFLPGIWQRLAQRIPGGTRNRLVAVHQLRAYHVGVSQTVGRPT